MDRRLFSRRRAERSLSSRRSCRSPATTCALRSRPCTGSRGRSSGCEPTRRAGADRYVGLIVEGSSQIAELLERLALVARIERGALRARAAASGLARACAGGRGVGAGGDVAVSGTGAQVDVDPVADRAVARRLAHRRDPPRRLERLRCEVHGPEFEIRPVTGEVATDPARRGPAGLRPPRPRASTSRRSAARFAVDGGCAGRPAAYFRRRDSRRSLSTRPPVWQSGQ